MVLLLVIRDHLEVQEHVLNVFFRLMDARMFPVHARKSQETLSSENITFEIQAGIDVSDVLTVQELSHSLEFFISSVSEIGVILDIETSTVCSSEESGYRCRCQEDFVWPLDRCQVDGCSGCGENPCRCLTVIPRDGQYCQRATDPDPTEAAQSVTHETEILGNNTEGSQTFTCSFAPHQQFSPTMTLRCTNSDTDQVNAMFGSAALNDAAAANCETANVGEIRAVCRDSTNVEDKQDSCVLEPIQRLLDWSELLNHLTLPDFLDELSTVAVDLTSEVVQSPSAITSIVKILHNVAGVALTTVLNQTLMEDVLLTAGVLTRDEARESWKSLYDVTINSSETNFPGSSSFERRTSNTNSFTQELVATRMSEILSVSSLFLQSLETITTRLINETVEIVTPLILLNKNRSRGSFNLETNLTEIDIPEANGFITAITFISMDNVLPARDEANSTSKFINGRVVLIQSTDTVDNISFAYERLNQSLENPECVFWNFSLFDGLGGWDDEGCQFVRRENNTFTCVCDHLTSFSMLMSIGTPDDESLAFITFIGLGISMISLIICLIIEAIVWKMITISHTYYLRHVGIVNIAVSLLIADIWLIVALTIPDRSNIPVCIAATFFVHFFYLTLFFWMLALALQLLYRTVCVFRHISKSSSLAVGFCLGYGAPIIIATITIAVTAPEDEYIRRTGGCWLNFDESRALLAFVIPALLIVLMNLIILIIVICKIWRTRTPGQPNETHVIWVIIRSLAVLTPLFGLTWALGVGTLVDPNNRGIHITFSLFNSLQGLFILVCGTLLDRRVRSSIAILHTGTKVLQTNRGLSSILGSIWEKRQDREQLRLSTSESSSAESLHSGLVQQRVSTSASTPAETLHQSLALQQVSTVESDSGGSVLLGDC
ncbi:adhesion G-protein coupled receptor F2-like [Salarias fasciatus]|uniref:adhesion G-protein coupled receptor F2-like n=1 Tax=Salarias fasciatus TaxID=181472 RepID=UPI001176A223|nr:adhesion G-protein coupled receptor F2-like [Salarias fasciatus]